MLSYRLGLHTSEMGTQRITIGIASLPQATKTLKPQLLNCLLKIKVAWILSSIIRTELFIAGRSL